MNRHTFVLEQFVRVAQTDGIDAKELSMASSLAERASKANDHAGAGKVLFDMFKADKFDDIGTKEHLAEKLVTDYDYSIHDLGLPKNPYFDAAAINQSPKSVLDVPAIHLTSAAALRGPVGSALQVTGLRIEQYTGLRGDRHLSFAASVMNPSDSFLPSDLGIGGFFSGQMAWLVNTTTGEVSAPSLCRDGNQWITQPGRNAQGTLFQFVMSVVKANTPAPKSTTGRYVLVFEARSNGASPLTVPSANEVRKLFRTGEFDIALDAKGVQNVQFEVPKTLPTPAAQ